VKQTRTSEKPKFTVQTGTVQCAYQTCPVQHEEPSGEGAEAKKQEPAKNLNSQFKPERSSVHIKPVRYNTCLSGRKSGNPVEWCPNIIKFYTQAHNTLRNTAPKFSPKLQGQKY
jgi:hypothetical protein